MSNESKQFREQIRLLNRNLGLLNKNSNNTFCCSKVTLSQCHALVEIGRADAISLKDLAALLLLDTSTTSRTVDSLVRKGYAKRVTDPADRRGINILLTKTGQVLFNDIENKMEKDFESYFCHIPEKEKDNVLHAMDIILNAFSKAKEL